MNHIKYLAFFLLLLPLGFSSCDLKEELIDTPTPEMLQTEKDVEVIIKGLYAGFNDPRAFKYRGVIMYLLCSDVFYSSGGSNFGPFSDKSFTAVNTAPLWNALYAAIAGANDLIYQLDRLDFEEDFERRAYGEAHFIRAFCYYYLVRLYGGVPLRVDAVDVNSDFYLPRSSIAEVYQQIFDDFRQATLQLPLFSDIPKTELGRASKGAAQALLAQAYLTYGDQQVLAGQDGSAAFKNAFAYADSVITSGQYRLINDYAAIFDLKKETQAYNEVIFGIRFQTDPQSSGQQAAGSELAFRFGAPNTWNVSGNPANGKGAGSYRLMPWVADFYRQGDYATTDSLGQPVIDYRTLTGMNQGGNGPKNKFYVTYPNIPEDNQGNIATPLLGKYIDPTGKDSRNNGNDYFIIRLAEVYLIKAEAENELHGPTPIALEAFNRVRARARHADGAMRNIPADLQISSELTQDSLRMAIFNERGLELLGEGQRWFDLVRMRSPESPSETMFAYQFLKELPGHTTDLPKFKKGPGQWSTQGAVYAPALEVTIPKYLLFPIPNTELLKNPNFGAQNPGW